MVFQTIVPEQDAVVLHVRFNERGWKTEPLATAPILDSTVVPLCTPLKRRFVAEAIHISTAGEMVILDKPKIAEILIFNAQVI